VLAFDGGNGWQDEDCIQWRWQWTMAWWWSYNGAVPAVGSDSVMDNGNDGGDGQWQWQQRAVVDNEEGIR
jgi:hypothetical protein